MIKPFKISLIKKIHESTLLSGSAIYLATSIVNASIPFTLIPILTRYLEPTEYGKIAIFQTLLTALSAFIGLNVTGAAARKYYDKQDNADVMKIYIASCLQILIFTTTLASIITWLLRDKISEWIGIESKWLLAAIFVSSMTVVINLRLSQWQVRNKAYKYGSMKISLSAADMGLSIIFVILLSWGATGRIEAQVIASLAVSLIALYYLSRDNLLKIFVWNKSYMLEALNFGIPLIPHVVGAFLLSSADRFIIGAELGIDKAGIYMVAVQISLGLGLIFDSINKAYVPWLFEKLKENNDNYKLKIVRNTYIWFGCIFIATLLSFWYGPLLVKYLTGTKYAEAGEIIGWLFLAQGFAGMYLMVTNYIFYSKQTGLLSVATIFTGLLNFLLVLLLINTLGLKAAAMSFCISMLIRFLLTWYIAHHKHPMPWFSNILKK